MLMLDVLVDEEQRKAFLDAVHATATDSRSRRAAVAAAVGGQVVRSAS